MPAKAKIRQIRITVKEDIDPDLSWLGKFTDSPKADSIDLKRSGYWGYYRYFTPAAREYAEQDFARILAYNRGDWQMVAVCAEADIDVPLGKSAISDTVSHCVWGVESNSGGAYLTEIAKDQLAELHAELEDMGFTEKQIQDAPFDGETDLFTYGDTDSPTPQPEKKLDLVFYGDPEPDEPPEEPPQEPLKTGFYKYGGRGSQYVLDVGARRPVRSYRRLYRRSHPW